MTNLLSSQHSFWPRMPCSYYCGFTSQMRRPHATCLWCRVRLYFTKKLWLKGWTRNRYTKMILPPRFERRIIILKDASMERLGHYFIPTPASAYVLYVNLDRHLPIIKDLFLKRILPRLEGERSYTESFLTRTMILFRKYLLTVCEGLAN